MPMARPAFLCCGHHAETEIDLSTDLGQIQIQRFYEGACGAVSRRVRRRRTRCRPPEVARAGHANPQRARRGAAVWKGRDERERTQRRSLRNVSVLIPGRDWGDATASGRTRVPARRGTAGVMRGRRRQSGQFDEKGIYYFHQKEECYDRSRSHR